RRRYSWKKMKEGDQFGLLEENEGRRSVWSLPLEVGFKLNEGTKGTVMTTHSKKFVGALIPKMVEAKVREISLS
ncbi:hypothetical protein TorRG33x02_164890, partial [Trema orientale]